MNIGKIFFLKFEPATHNNVKQADLMILLGMVKGTNADRNILPTEPAYSLGSQSAHQ